MTFTLAFDVYGTLIDTHGVVSKLQEFFNGDEVRARAFSQAWREKQLEYAFRRGLMQNYKNFAACTRDALNYTKQLYAIDLTDSQTEELLGLYRTLPAFEDAKEGLAALKAAGHRLYAFSNGSADTVETLLEHAGIRDDFLDVISVEALQSFKPNPAVYAHFLRETNSTGGNAWLISSNPFDVIGSISAGMRSAWIQRSPTAIFDPWEIQPTITVNNLTELSDALADNA